MDLVQYDLPNGIHVILQQSASAPVVACNVWVGVGSADETPQEAGLAHVHEHMLFKGTKRRGVGQIAREVEASGGHINAFTSFDQTCYYVVMSSRFLDNGLDILADAIQNSAFEAEELGRELEVIQEEIKRGEDSPSRVASMKLFEASYTTHPYKLPVIGTKESVDSFTREHVLSFFHKHYVPSNMTVVLVGDFELEQAKQKIEELFGGFEGQPYSRVRRPLEPAQQELRAAIIAQESQECHLRIGFHIPEATHEDIPALDMLGVILGQGEASQLHRSIQREQELVSGIYAGAYTPRESGLFMLSADYQLVEEGQEDEPGPRTHAQVIEAIFEQLMRFEQDELDEDELLRARTILESQAIYSKQTIEGLAMKYGQYHMVAGDALFEQRYYEGLASLEIAKLRDVAHKYLTLENCTIVLSHPNQSPTIAADAAEAAARQGALKAAKKSPQPKSVRVLKERAAKHQSQGDKAPSVAVELDEKGFTKVKINNGPTLIIQEDHSVELYALKAMTLGGVRLERPEVNGVNSILSELLVRGTSTLDAEQIAMATESMATSLSGMSGRNTFGISLSGLSKYLEPGLELMSQCWFDATLPQDELERERFLHLQHLKSRQDQLGAVNFDRFSEAFFQGHPYAMPVEGTDASIRGLTRESIAGYFDEVIRPQELVMAIVGDVDAAQIIERISAQFADTTPKTKSAILAPSAPQKPAAPKQLVGDLEKNQAHIIVGFDAPLLSDQDRYTLDVLHTVLSGQGGRLFLELRDRQSLAYSVYASVLLGLETSSFMITIGTSPEKIEQAVFGMVDQVRLLQEGITQQELDDAKRFLIGNHDIGLQRTSGRAMASALDELYGLGYKRTYDYSDAISAVSAADVQDIARRYLNLDQTLMAITKPSATEVTDDLLERALKAR